jgi:hypothetical protein
VAEANTQFGAGGGTRLFVPDSGRALADRQLFEKLDHPHVFDADSLKSRFEDPAFRATDPSYQDLDAHAPVRALDLAHEKRMGRLEGLEERASKLPEIMRTRQ